MTGWRGTERIFVYNTAEKRENEEAEFMSLHET